VASIALVAAACAGAAERHVGRVTHVVDGQSVDVVVKAKRLRVRLAGIDAPRAGQPFGLRSRQALVQLCGGEIATIDATGKADNGSLIAHVACAGTDASAEQVRLGMARVSDDGSAGRQLTALENEARAAHRGLWSTKTGRLSPSARASPPHEQKETNGFPP
jgi:endonuclease YncB( thermonuclease family)